MRPPPDTLRGIAATDRASSGPALFSGRPAFPDLITVGKPNVVDAAATLARIGEALDRVWLTNGGPLVREFETRIADELGVAHAIATANATVALDLLLQVSGVEGDVIMPSWTFVADPHVALWRGLRPVFCDVDRSTHCLDPDRVEAAITPSTGAIMGVHLWGNGCDVVALDRIADRHDVPVFYDAAHAYACSIGGRPIGGFGRAEVFSFHATKMVTCFEGGAITTDDDDLAEQLRLARNFGFAGEDTVARVGVNAKMSEPCAAMGLSSLDGVDRLVAHNRDNHGAYTGALAPVPGVDVCGFDSADSSNRHYVVVEIDEARAGLSRDEIVAALRLDNVECRRYFAPGCHRQEPYRRTHPTAGETLPVTEELSDAVMVLPTGLGVAPETAAAIGCLIAGLVERAPAARSALADTDPALFRLTH